MEGLHNRKKEKVNEEDQVEFLDEEEQEKLLQDLRDQNNKANAAIQKGLIIIGCITSALFFNIVLQKDSPPIIPISQVISEYPIETVLSLPTLAAITGIISISASIFALIMTSKMNVFGLLTNSSSNDQYTSGAVYASITSGLVAPLMSLYHGSLLMELIYWSIPLFVGMMYYTAHSMIKQVQTSLEELEKSKYKYKGA